MGGNAVVYACDSHQRMKLPIPDEKIHSPPSSLET
jgi:hypothetical protein